jgi:hypothetical protein
MKEEERRRPRERERDTHTHTHTPEPGRDIKWPFFPSSHSPVKFHSDKGCNKQTGRERFFQEWGLSCLLLLLQAPPTYLSFLMCMGCARVWSIYLSI